MLNLGTGELLIVFLVALLVLGPSKLPEAARQAGRVMAELRRLSSGFQAEMRDAMREPPPTLPPLPAEARQPPAATSTATAPSPDAEPPATRRRRAPLRAGDVVASEDQRSE